MKKILPLLVATFGSAPIYAAAPNDFQINGFLSVAGAWSNVTNISPVVDPNVEPYYVSWIHRRPSFDKDSNIGIQLSKYLRDDVSITVQLLAQGENEWEVDATWAFLKYEPTNNWQFRVGRVRTQPYMLSDYVDVGYAYPWVRPPQEVYSQIPSEFSNYTGVDARFRMEFCKREFSFTAFYGQATTRLSFPAYIPYVLPQQGALFDEPYLRFNDLISLSMKFGDEVFSVRAGYEATRFTLDPNAGTAMQNLNTFMDSLIANGLLGPDYTNFFSAYNTQASFAGVGYQFDWNNVVSMGELVKRGSSSPIMANVVGWYLMGGYRIKQFLPNITFARERLLGNKVRRFNSVVNNTFMAPAPLGAGSPVSLDSVATALINTSRYYDGGAGDQTSVTYGIRWDIIDGVAIKAEVSHVHPDNLSPGLFDFNPLKSVNIYSIAVDAVM